MSTHRFDSAAADWDKKDQRRELAAAIAAGIGELPLHPEMEALEYGCGTGLVGLALAPRLKSLTAADSSPGMLRALADKIAQAGITNVSPLLLDLHHETCPRQFDLVFSAMTLHHLADVETVLHRLVPALKPGGLLALADLDREDGSFHGSASEGVVHHGFDRIWLTDLLFRQGCGTVEIRTVHTVVKPDAEGNSRPYPVFLLTAARKTP
jgi:2-polyprenyl-3-methyl-5-hydroxy-6-metoxy-1,4-benzoquinol methylase